VQTTEFSTISWVVYREERTKMFNWKLAHLTVVSGGHHSQDITEMDENNWNFCVTKYCEYSVTFNKKIIIFGLANPSFTTNFGFDSKCWLLVIWFWFYFIFVFLKGICLFLTSFWSPRRKKYMDSMLSPIT